MKQLARLEMVVTAALSHCGGVDGTFSWDSMRVLGRDRQQQ